MSFERHKNDIVKFATWLRLPEMSNFFVYMDLFENQTPWNHLEPPAP